MLTSAVRHRVRVGIPGLVLLLASLLPPPLAAQDDPWSNGSVGTGLLLRKLDGVKRVLLIGAHPDDEDTALLTTLARGMGVETAYLSLTRGEGGQNLIGPELDEGLGIVRTGELLAARSLDGARQYFTRAFDFGYSKSGEEALRFWPREELLRDATWVVRTFRPQVIISVFSGTPRDGHGQHQAAGIIARDVFEAAGDPSRFPEQIRAGAVTWTPAKLYQRTRGTASGELLSLETGVFDPLLGRSYFQVAMESRSQHRSQDMGMPQPLGPRSSSLTLVQSRVQGGEAGLFAGVDTALVTLTEGLPAGIRDPVAGDLRAYRAGIAEAREGLSVAEPWRTTPALGRALEALDRIESRLEAGVGDGESSGAVRELRTFLADRTPLAQKAFLRSAEVVVDARVDEALLVPGESVGAVLEVWNGGPYAMEVDPALLPPEGWGVEEEGSGAPRSVAPGSVEQWSFTVRVPPDAELSKLYYLKEARNGELYRWPTSPELWGEPRNPELLFGVLGMRVGEWGAVELRTPLHYRGVDKARGEFVEPVLVVPPLSVSVDPSVMAWPLGANEPREVGVAVESQSGRTRSGTVTLDLPPGWQARPASRTFSLSSRGEEASFTFRVSVPADLKEGSYRTRARLRTDDGAEYREGMTLVDYPHIPRGILFADAESRVSAFPVAVPEGLRVGYVMGSGDDGPAAIRQMGLEVDLLAPETVRAGAFDGYDVVVLGIRAYETRPDLAAANDRLLDFARGGGTVIVQYNKYEFPSGGYAPYPVQMARPHDRVADETVPVRILEPDHPLFNRPNVITPKDFEGWAQERGLYFLSQWDDHYRPLLEMADPGEDPKRGGLLVTRLGDGAYVYTGIAFFRQFPEGVPGAYRLFANLLALRGEDVGPGEQD